MDGSLPRTFHFLLISGNVNCQKFLFYRSHKHEETDKSPSWRWRLWRVDLVVAVAVSAQTASFSRNKPPICLLRVGGTGLDANTGVVKAEIINRLEANEGAHLAGMHGRAPQ